MFVQLVYSSSGSTDGISFPNGKTTVFFNHLELVSYVSKYRQYPLLL
jgi:hypothetical protein